MIQTLVAVIVIMHGFAHISGFLASWTGIRTGYSDAPMLFTESISLQSKPGKIFGIAWLIAMILLISGGIGILTQFVYWSHSLTGGAIISLIVIVPWWDTVPTGAKLGALVDLAALIILQTPLKEQFL